MGFELPKGETLTGLVLAASAELLDPNFHRTVVYIAEHTVEGALGLVMNRPINKKLGEVAESPDLPDALRDTPVFRGGPVKPTGLVLARFERGKSDEELHCQIVADPMELIVAAKAGVGPRVCGLCRVGRGTTGGGVMPAFVDGVPSAHGAAGSANAAGDLGGIRQRRPALAKTVAAVAEEYGVELAGAGDRIQKTGDGRRQRQGSKAGGRKTNSPQRM